MRYIPRITVWTAFLTMLQAVPSFSLDFSSLMFSPERRSSIRYSGGFQQIREKVGAGIQQEKLSSSIQAWENGKNRVSASCKLGWLDVSGDGIGPGDLYEIGTGVTYAREIEEDRSVAVNVGYGSASDKPFKDSSVNTLSATAFYSFAGSSHDRWLLLLNYSNNRPILNGIPLPGFAYSYSSSKRFHGTFGVPFAFIRWEFTDRWTLDVMAIVPWILKTSVSYSVSGPFQVFAGLDYSQETYFLHGRENKRERFFFDQKKAFLGAKSPLSRSLTAELQGGYAFGRRFFEAENYMGFKRNESSLGGGWLIELALNARL